MVKILLAEDHKILREGLKALLNRHANMQVIAEACDGAEAVQTARDCCPDIVVMDVMMPRMNGIEATRSLKKDMPAVKVVGLSMYTNANFIYEMFKAGAEAFLMKDCSYDELEEAVLSVSRGEKYIGECLKSILSEMFLASLLEDRRKDDEEISIREIEVLSLLADGLTNKDVAEKLFLSANTVACHRQNIMKKLGLKNTAELTKYAIRKGYIAP